jgi:magnesium chelatase family protein
LLDRIDLQVLVEPIPYSSLIHRCSGESSADIQARVIAARKRQAQRLGPQRCNRDMHHHEIQRDVHLDAESNGLLEKATEQQGLSSRAITRILKVTRTIADLDDSDKTQKCHLEEALSLRKAGLAYREGGK